MSPILLALGQAAENLPLADIIETVAGWLDGQGTTPEQMHAALTEASIRRAKAIKATADDAAFGTKP